MDTYYAQHIGMVESELSIYVGGLLLVHLDQELESINFEPAQATFDDVPFTHENYDAITYLNEAGIIDGYDSGDYAPEQSLNRAELLKILVESQVGTPSASTYSNCFSDVGTDWYAKYVCYAKDEGWIEGYSDGSFRPGNTVNKAEAIKMLLTTHDVTLIAPDQAPYEDVELDAWYSTYVYTAKDLGLLEEDGDNFEPGDEKTRGSVAENMYRLVE